MTSELKLERLTIKAIMNEMSLLRNAVEANTKKLDEINAKIDKIWNREDVDSADMPTGPSELCETEKMQPKVDIMDCDENDANIEHDNNASDDYITSLDDDCLEHIFKRLEWCDLLSLADCSKRFHTAISMVFKMKYSNDLVELGTETQM